MISAEGLSSRWSRMEPASISSARNSRTCFLSVRSATRAAESGARGRAGAGHFFTNESYAVGPNVVYGALPSPRLSPGTSAVASLGSAAGAHEEPPFRKDEEEETDHGQEDDEEQLHPHSLEHGRLFRFFPGFHRSISLGGRNRIRLGHHHRRLRIAFSSRFRLAVVLG